MDNLDKDILAYFKREAAVAEKQAQTLKDMGDKKEYIDGYLARAVQMDSYYSRVKELIGKEKPGQHTDTKEMFKPTHEPRNREY